MKNTMAVNQAIVPIRHANVPAKSHAPARWKGFWIWLRSRIIRLIASAMVEDARSVSGLYPEKQLAQVTGLAVLASEYVLARQPGRVPRRRLGSGMGSGLTFLPASVDSLTPRTKNIRPFMSISTMSFLSMRSQHRWASWLWVLEQLRVIPSWSSR